MVCWQRQQLSPGRSKLWESTCATQPSSDPTQQVLYLARKKATKAGPDPEVKVGGGIVVATTLSESPHSPGTQMGVDESWFLVLEGFIFSVLLCLLS